MYASKNSQKLGYSIFNFFPTSLQAIQKGEVKLDSAPKNHLCYCSSCEDCTNKINDPNCIIIKLNRDIRTTLTCINNPLGFDHKIFDCQGHLIDGMRLADDGIYMYCNGEDRSGNVVQNCKITGFGFGNQPIRAGINLQWGCNNNTFINNSLYENFQGIRLDLSNNCTIANSSIYSNSDIGIFSPGSYNTIINNEVYLNKGRYGIFGGYILLNNRVYSNGEGILVIAGSTIINNSVYSNSRSGIQLWGAVQNNITNNVIYSNMYGIRLDGDSTQNNALFLNKIINNSVGIYSGEINGLSNFNQISSNFVCYNSQLDFNSSNWRNNQGISNTCDRPDGWHDDNQNTNDPAAGCKYKCSSSSFLH